MLRSAQVELAEQKKSGRGAHFDRREWAQVDGKFSHFFVPDRDQQVIGE